jgi:Domain of unknown function (DUF5668)
MNKSGIVLIIVGALLLAHNFGLLGWHWLRQWWPALLIVLGIWSLVAHRPGDNQRNSRDGDRTP